MTKWHTHTHSMYTYTRLNATVLKILLHPSTKYSTQSQLQGICIIRLFKWTDVSELFCFPLFCIRTQVASLPLSPLKVCVAYNAEARCIIKFPVVASGVEQVQDWVVVVVGLGVVWLCTNGTHVLYSSLAIFSAHPMRVIIVVCKWRTGTFIRVLYLFSRSLH